MLRLKSNAGDIPAGRDRRRVPPTHAPMTEHWAAPDGHKCGVAAGAEHDYVGGQPTGT